MNTTLFVSAVAFAFVGIGVFTLAAAINCIVDAWRKRDLTRRGF